MHFCNRIIEKHQPQCCTSNLNLEITQLCYAILHLIFDIFKKYPIFSRLVQLSK